MKGIQAFIFGAGLLATGAQAISLAKRTDGPPKVLGLDIERKLVADPIARDRLRRRGTVQTSLDNEVGGGRHRF